MEQARPLPALAWLLLSLALSACSHSTSSPNPGATGTGSGASNGNGSGGSIANAPSAQAGQAGSASANLPNTSAGHAAGSGGMASVTIAVDAGLAGAASGGSGSGAADAAIVPDAGGTQLGPTQTLIPDPAWDCRMPTGIPPVQGATLVFEANLTLGETMDLGQTQYGQRKIFPITGGTFKGPKISGQFMNGGLDWQLTRDDGALEIEEVAILTTSTGESVYLRNCGVAADSSGEVRIVPDFEAGTNGSYAFLNGKFIGTRELDAQKKTMKLSVYETPAAPPAGSSVSVPTTPASQPRQAWACEPAPGTAGTLVYTEAVGIGGGIGIGASKYGSRNIIPITGGTFSGQKLNGDVVPGGADFQLTADGSLDLQLDARYTLKTDDGQLIAVRNCGNAAGTKLYFETLAAGTYAWLTSGKYTSSVGLAVGGVAISIYEAN